MKRPVVIKKVIRRRPKQEPLSPSVRYRDPCRCLVGLPPKSGLPKIFQKLSARKARLDASMSRMNSTLNDTMESHRGGCEWHGKSKQLNASATQQSFNLPNFSMPKNSQLASSIDTPAISQNKQLAL